MKNKRMFWHEYHEGLLSWCTSYWGRLWQIILYKSAKEWFVRIRRFKKVKGDLPEELIVASFNRRNSYPNDLRELLNKHHKLIKALHTKECKNCPYNGQTLFPIKGEEK